MKTATNPLSTIVSRDEWLRARRELLTQEKALTRQYDAVAAARRALPWVRIEKEYIFDMLDGKRTLSAVEICRNTISRMQLTLTCADEWAERKQQCSPIDVRCHSLVRNLYVGSLSVVCKI